MDPSGRSVGQYVREEIAIPLGVDSSCFLGQFPATTKETDYAPTVPTPIIPYTLAAVLARSLLQLIENMAKVSEETLCRVVPTINAPLKDMHWKRMISGLGFIPGLRKLVGPNFSSKCMGCLDFFGGGKIDKLVNEHWWHFIEAPSGNGIANARALARIAACMAEDGQIDGVRLLRRETVQDAHADPQTRLDCVIEGDTTFTNAGFCVFEGPTWDKITHGLVGWGGIGGSFCAWQPEERIGISYTMTGMGPLIWSIVGASDKRCLGLVKATREVSRKLL